MQRSLSGGIELVDLDVDAHVQEVQPALPVQRSRRRTPHQRQNNPQTLPTMSSIEASVDQVLPHQLASLLAGFRGLQSDLRVLVQRRTAERAVETATIRPSSSNPGAGVGLNSDSGEPELVPADPCVICLEPLTAPDSVATRCGHVFHTHCLLQCPPAKAKGRAAKTATANCPICRASVHSAELVQLRNGLPSNAENNPRKEEPQPCPVPTPKPQANPASSDTVDDVESCLSDNDKSNSDCDVPLMAVARRERRRAVVIDDGDNNSGKRINSNLVSRQLSAADRGLEIDKEIKLTMRAIVVGIERITAANKMTQCVKAAKAKEKEALQRERQAMETERMEARKTAHERKRQLDELEFKVIRSQEEISSKRASLDEQLATVSSERERLASEARLAKTQREELRERQVEVQDRLAELRQKEERLARLLKTASSTNDKKRVRNDRSGAADSDEIDDLDRVEKNSSGTNGLKLTTSTGANARTDAKKPNVNSALSHSSLRLRGFGGSDDESDDDDLDSDCVAAGARKEAAAAKQAAEELARKKEAEEAKSCVFGPGKLGTPRQANFPQGVRKRSGFAARGKSTGLNRFWGSRPGVQRPGAGIGKKITTKR